MDLGAWSRQVKAAISLIEQPTAEARRDPTFTERVQALLRAHAENEPPSMVDAAKTLGVSERSLRRRLELEGKNYREIVQDATFEKACVMLKDPGQTIKKIAHTLGYSCHASFHRAFARWAATTPLTYREDPSVRSGTRHVDLQRRLVVANASTETTLPA